MLPQQSTGAGLSARRARTLPANILLLLFATACLVPALPAGGFTAATGAGARRGQQQLPALEVGQPVERDLAGGQAHSYRLVLAAGQFLDLVVEQRGIDVVVTLFGPDDKALVEVDSPNGSQGPEPLAAIAETAGAYRLEVRSLEQNAAAGRYQAKLIELRAATAQDRSRIAAQKDIAEAEALRGEMTAESLRKAIEKYVEAAPLARAAGAQHLETEALVSLGVLHSMLGEKQQALDYYTQALALSRAAGDRANEAVTLNNFGATYDDLGEKQKALDYYVQALAVYRGLGDHEGEARTLNNLGKLYDDLGEKQKAIEQYTQSLAANRVLQVPGIDSIVLNNLGKVYQELGENQRALDYYTQALPILRRINDQRGIAVVMTNIGRVYGDLGDEQKALDYYTQALPVLRAVGDRGNEARTLNNIGGMFNSLGDRQKALDYYTQSLSLWRGLGDRQREAITLLNIGSTYGDLGDSQKALDYYTQVLPLSRAAGDRGNEATTLNNIGWEYYVLHDYTKALENYEQALPLLRAVGNRRGEATTLDNIALLERAQGDLPGALKNQEAVINILESLRSKVVSQDLRASYFATVQGSYKLYVDLLMRLHKEHPSEGYDGRALQASERGRARSLLEVLSESGADIRAGADPQLLARERALQQQLDLKETAQLKMLTLPHTAEQAAAAKREIEQLLDQYRELEAQIKATSPRYAALTQPQPLDVAAIQKQLDPSTLLLEYALGDERGSKSYVWAVTSKSLESYELPAGSAEIEKAARHFYELLDARNRRTEGETEAARLERLAQADAELPQAAAALSRMVVAPVAALLGKKRLVVVADGALQYIPFAVLPSNAPRNANGSGQPLIVEHEIVALPSASAIAALRRETAGRKPAPKTLAMLADPVFSAEDERVPGKSTETAKQEKKPGETNAAGERILEQAAESGDPLLKKRLRIRRLPYTKQEAEQILKLVPASESIKAFGFDASRAMVMSGALSSYRYLHFATHGYLDTQQPELSAIVFSLVNERGEAQQGFLRAHEVYNLQLPAELVVLSACETGLGKEIKGEGLVGLTRGFMYAGTPRVVVSLWSVSDKATADLMGKFYQGVLVDRLSPAAALRAAQIAMSKDKQWSSPYYWAAFTLQGEWR